MRASFGNLLFISVILCLSTGCNKYATRVSAAVDPTFSPSKEDTVFVTLSADPTIKERQLLPILIEELCRNGFNIVQNPQSSMWTLGLSYERQTYQFGSTNTAVILPGVFPTALAFSTPNIVTDSNAYLYLFKSEDFLASRLTRVWEGSVSATDRVFKVYRPIIFKNLLDSFGENVERRIGLSKSYLGKVEKAGKCDLATAESQAVSTQK